MVDIQAQSKFVPELSFSDILWTIWRRKFLVILIVSLSVTGTYLYLKRVKRLYKATAKLSVTQRASTLVSSPEASYAAPLIETPETQLELIQSTKMTELMYFWLKNEFIKEKPRVAKLSDDAMASLPARLQSMISAEVPTQTSIIVLNVTSSDPVEAATVANAIGYTLEEWKKEQASKSVKDSKAKLVNRAQRAKNYMLEAELQETRFKQKSKLADIPAQQKAALEQYLQRDVEVASLKQQLTSDVTRLKSIKGQLNEVEDLLKLGSEVQDNEQVQQLQRQLKQLEIEKAKAELKYTREFPGILPDLEAQIKDIQERLEASIQKTVDNRLPSLDSHKALVDNYKQAQLAVITGQARFKAAVALRDRLKAPLSSIPDTSMKYAQVALNADLARKTYASLQAALNAVNVNQDAVDGNVALVANAVKPEEPFYPNPPRIYLIAVLIGTGTAVMLALFLENKGSRVRSLQDVRTLGPAPIIGVLPRMSRTQMKRLEAGDSPPMAREIYNMARANFALIARNSGSVDPWDQQIVMITSAVPGEGKSITAAHMARTLARAGKKVILVDADMRRPRQCRYFDTDEGFGLADVLSRRMTLNEALSASDTDNLRILYSGTPSRNPSELLSLSRLTETLDKLREAADVVMIDTPACGVVADAMLLAPYADSIVQVVGIGKADEEVVRDTTVTLQSVAPKNFVVFVNHAPREQRHGYSSYYSRDYLREEEYEGTEAAGSDEVVVLQEVPEGKPEDASEDYEPTLRLKRIVVKKDEIKKEEEQ